MRGADDPSAVVDVGFSLGEAVAQELTQTRPRARRAKLFYSLPWYDADATGLLTLRVHEVLDCNTGPVLTRLPAGATVPHPAVREASSRVSRTRKSRKDVR